MLRGEPLSAKRIAAEVEALCERAAAGLNGAELEAVYELRYAGQAFELPIAGALRPQPAELAEAFADEHERRYGYRDPEADVELVTIRIAAVVPGREPRAEAAAGKQLERSTREARFGERRLEAEVLRGEPGAGTRAAGPCVFELPEATLVLPPGWRAEVDAHGTVVAERGGRA